MGGWAGGDDSFYEYLIKMYVYDSSSFGAYKDRWVAAADSSIQYLASHPSSRPDLTFLAQYDGTQRIFESEHRKQGQFVFLILVSDIAAVACFAGGNFILGGVALGEQKYIDFGLELVDACYDTYAKDATGIGPGAFAWLPEACNGASSDPNCTIPGPYVNQTTFYDESGFWITDPSYDLQPEVLESLYYAYRVTGNTTYQDWSWAAFQAINATTRVGSGYSQINNVNVVGGDGFTNTQESFLFAEVWKYAYLIHAEDGPWQVYYQGENQFVFNTEAHPFKVKGGPLP